MYFAYFWANFWDFLTIVLFYCLKWVLKSGYEAFFFKRIIKCRKLKLFFIIFCSFSFSAFRQVSEPIMTWLFREHLDTLLAEKNFSLELCAFVILNILLTFANFLSNFFCKSLFFHDFGFKYLKNFYEWF